MGNKTRITEKERLAIVQSIRQGWSDKEISAMIWRTTGREITRDLLYNMRVGVKFNPGYPALRWKKMNDAEKEMVIKSVIAGEMSQTQAETAYRVDNGVIKQAVKEYRTPVKPNTKQEEKQTAEQTTLYNKKEYDYEDSIKSVIKAIESGAFPYSITQDESGTTLFYSNVDEYGNTAEIKIFTKKRYQISLKEIEQ